MKDVKLDDSSDIYVRFEQLARDAGYSTMKAAVMAAMRTVLLKGFADFPLPSSSDDQPPQKSLEDKSIWGEG